MPKTGIPVDTWKCGSLSFIFTHPPEDEKINEKTTRCNSEIIGGIGSRHEDGASWRIRIIGGIGSRHEDGASWRIRG